MILHLWSSIPFYSERYTIARDECNFSYSLIHIY